MKIYEADIVDIVREADVGRDGLREEENPRGPVMLSSKSVTAGSNRDPERSRYVAIYVRRRSYRKKTGTCLLG